ncbi:MAG: metal-dependent hydrolase [Acidimicrobiales bacterium]
MSWGAHQFETYAIQAHLPKRWQLKVSYLAIVIGDQLPDFIAKFWVYGFNLNGRHYGAKVPQQFHRGWPGAGWSHSLVLGFIVVALWLWRTKDRPWSRAWAAGFILGFGAHCVTDINDSVGTMLLFPFSTANFSIGTWAYAATVKGGKYLDAAAYYSSFGLVMDLIWLVIVVCSWRVLTRHHWRTRVVAADPRAWAWLGRRLSEPLLLAVYRATFFYGVCRVVAWTVWAHLITGDQHPWGLHWGGPDFVTRVHLSSLPVWLVLVTAASVLALVCYVADRIVAGGERQPAELEPAAP